MSRSGIATRPSAVPPQGADTALVAQTAVGAGTDRYLAFQLSGETYALPILDVAEIIEFRRLTAVPTMPDYIRGVLNLRGTVVPVVDLAASFGLTPTSVTRRTSILIIDTNDGRHEHSQRLGVLVDAVNKVLHVSTEDIQPPPELGGDLRGAMIKGMARHVEEFIVILDLNHQHLHLDDLRTGHPRQTADQTTDATQA